MAAFVLLLLGAAFVISSTFLLIFKQGSRNVILNRLRFRRRRASGSSTPPRSLSPGKKKPDNISTPDYSDTFPPSRRFALAEIQSELPAKLGRSLDALTSSPPDSRKSCLPLATSYLEAKKPLYTPCEFSTEEIKALGDFLITLLSVGYHYHAHTMSLTSKGRFPGHIDLLGGTTIKQCVSQPKERQLSVVANTHSALTKMEPDWWLELENTYEKRIKQRQDLFAEHGTGVLDALPGSELACKELMEMALQFLCARYPQYFRLDTNKTVFHNDILHTETDLKASHPLQVLLNNIPEDFAITLRDPTTGYYSFRAGIICSSLGWNVATKIGLLLHEIHAPIPDYKEKMQFSMDRYFAKKPTDKAIQRGSWGLEVDQPLYMPPGDPHEKHRDVQNSDLDASRCHLRVDWQTLRRLPLSGGIVFNFKALFTPIESFRDEPFVPALVLKVLKDGKRTLMDYKNTWHTEHVVIPALEEYAREQVERGIVSNDWEPHTLEESPWFPGWEEKWHREQGY